MICVHAPSRLHFGLFSFGRGPRQYGGVGAMIDAPGVVVRVDPSDTLEVEGPLSERAVEFACRFAGGYEETLHCKITVQRAAQQHAGLGTGTQLGMAIGRALAQFTGEPPLSPTALARRVGRGERSAVGVHGFHTGGLIVEGGKRQLRMISPLVARVAWPDQWRFVLAIPTSLSAGSHGVQERQLFSQLPPIPETTTARLCQLALMGLLPAATDNDIVGFGEALYELNHLAGECFAPVQGDVYADPRLTALVQFIRTEGVPGVGQSSWGPTIFAVVETEDRATALAERVRSRFGLSSDEVFVTRPNNHGASLVDET